MGAVRLRAKLEDFVVEELVPERIPQEGEHLHVRIEKRGLSTEEAVKRMARALGVRPGHVGRCGRKDVRALARQWLSFAGVSERDVEALDLEDVRVLEHVRLPRKLRKGRFLGNRFRLRLRELPSGAEARARQGLQELAVRGLRNAFGGGAAILLFGPESAMEGIPFYGITAFVDPATLAASPFLAISGLGAGNGYVSRHLPLALMGAGTQWYAQWLVLDPASPSPQQPVSGRNFRRASSPRWISASEAVSFTVF